MKNTCHKPQSPRIGPSYLEPPRRWLAPHTTPPQPLPIEIPHPWQQQQPWPLLRFLF
ncbi:hypothetical protein HanXRQr2_Chr11g0466491 [Helianthus annuus]|uniref:Uncharacterized protein n=1 Tax=Helianthus annuus TaxID=4232 RepID=A0A9K3HKQ1_HELAN|nr:hypothetical protein HanXRQr2_Chr11g0466491 [Helianthus annuus]